MQSGIEPSILNTIVQGDCVKSLTRLPLDVLISHSRTLLSTSGMSTTYIKTRKVENEYLRWTRKWIEQVFRVLKSAGTFWLAIGMNTPQK